MWNFIKRLLLGLAAHNTKQSKLDTIFQGYQRQRILGGEPAAQYEDYLKVVRKRDGHEKEVS